MSFQHITKSATAIGEGTYGQTAAEIQLYQTEKTELEIF